VERHPYILDEQVGFILRQVSQRHTTLFAARMASDITPTQWAVLSKLFEVGPTSQNLLGRMTAMDVATIKGVVDRLMKRGLIGTAADATDARRRLVALTTEGTNFVANHISAAIDISEETLSALDERERAEFLRLLEKMK
jgi:DNA-binding MarR family transcriptional regulator